MTVEHCDVLIVGAGPVGMLLAVLLHDQGVRVQIIERQKALYPLPRAVAFDHESRRLFGIAGLTDQVAAIVEERLLKGGEDGQNFVWRDANLKRFPFGNNFHQPTLEKLLEDTVHQRGIKLTRGYAVTAVHQHADHVEAEFAEFVPAPGGCSSGVVIDGVVGAKGGNGSGVPAAAAGTTDPSKATFRVSSQYLVGCDGANSTVRRLEGITQSSIPFENDWLILDLLLRDGYVPPLVARIGAAQICDPVRPTTCIFAGKGRRRFEFMRVPGESREHLLEDKTVWELLGKYGFTPDNVDLERKVIYTFNARWCDDFYKGRVMLAGDALHLMPPFIGQGLNSGFRDAGRSLGAYL